MPLAPETCTGCGTRLMVGSGLCTRADCAKGIPSDAAADQRTADRLLGLEIQRKARLIRDALPPNGRGTFLLLVNINTAMNKCEVEVFRTPTPEAA